MANFKVKNGLQAGRYLGTNGTETAGTEGYSLGAASYDSVSLSVTAQVGTPTGLFFKPDGTKMFIIDLVGQDISEYSLSTAWDLSTASYVTVFSVSSQDTNPWGLFFKPDGTAMYLTGRANDTIFQYTLSTAWDLSTASYASKSYNVLSQNTVPQVTLFKPDGTKAYVVGGSPDEVSQISLSTAWDISTASNDGVEFSVQSETSGSAIYGSFKSDGTHLFVLNNSTVFQYNLGTAWDLSTASYSGISFSLSDVADTSKYALVFKADGSKLYLVTGNTDSVHQFSTAQASTTIDLSTGTTFNFTSSGVTTVSFTNPPASGIATGFTVEINGDGSAITWPSSIKWHEGTVPTATASKEVYTFITVNGGTTYYGKKAGENLA